MRRLLVVSYYYPPFPGSGGRWQSMARHLRRAGHRVTVVTTDAFGHLGDDLEGEIVRVRDLRSVDLLRRTLRRGELPIQDSTVVERPPSALLTRVVVPELSAFHWLPGLALAVQRLLAGAAYDCLVTSSPPESAHLVALLLGRRRPAWVADLRDGWTYETIREPFPTNAQSRLDHWLERRVATTAEVVVGATRPIADDLRRRFGGHAAYVPNAWDPVSLSLEASGRPPPGEASDAKTLVYTGVLSGGWGRDPEPFLRALGIVRSEPEGAALQLLHAGRVTPEERSLIDRSGLSEAVTHLGILERCEVLELQRAAGALVLVTSRQASEATGKLFEYLAAGRPIIALAEGNEAARIVRDTNTGIVVPPDDVEAIADALRRAASGELARAYAPHGLDRYTYPAPAERMAELIEEAILRRATGRGRDTP